MFAIKWATDWHRLTIVRDRRSHLILLVRAARFAIETDNAPLMLVDSETLGM